MSPGGDYDIWAQRTRLNGLVNGHPKMIIGGPGNQSHPDIIWTTGEWLVVWSDDNNDGGRACSTPYRSAGAGARSGPTSARVRDTA